MTRGAKPRAFKCKVIVDKKPCLKCQKMFPSVGKFNRICDKCHEKNDTLGGITEMHGCGVQE